VAFSSQPLPAVVGLDDAVREAFQEIQQGHRQFCGTHPSSSPIDRLLDDQAHAADRQRRGHAIAVLVYPIGPKGQTAAARPRVVPLPVIAGRHELGRIFGREVIQVWGHIG